MAIPSRTAAAIRSRRIAAARARPARRITTQERRGALAAATRMRSLVAALARLRRHGRSPAVMLAAVRGPASAAAVAADSTAAVVVAHAAVAVTGNPSQTETTKG